MSQQRGNRSGDIFTLRLTAEQRAELQELQARSDGPRALGPWLLWAAMQHGSTLPADSVVVPDQVQSGDTLPRQPLGITSSSGLDVIPARVDQVAIPEFTPTFVIPKPIASLVSQRIVLDLCGGSGAWSKPYADAGYDVRLVTWPDLDVRTYQPPSNVHGVLAAPPCTEFSVAKASQRRNFAQALEPVIACLRIIALCQPKWWAIENPGRSLLAHWLGPARDTWEPFEFGDPWTKRTALWGQFRKPKRGPWVKPKASAMSRSSAAARAVTPPGFAQAFYKVNP